MKYFFIFPGEFSLELLQNLGRHVPLTQVTQRLDHGPADPASGLHRAGGGVTQFNGLITDLNLPRRAIGEVHHVCGHLLAQAQEVCGLSAGDLE